MGKEEHQVVEGNDFQMRRRIEPLEFEFSFDPRNFCKEAYLLYEIQWGNSRDVWRHSGKNTTKHVERNFIEKIASERHFRPSISCSISWYLSWSPCWECSKAIREFLNQHPNVTLVIYIARLFQHMDPQNRQGLKDLFHSGVTIQVMRDPGSPSLLTDFKKTSESAQSVQTYSSKLSLPNDSTLYPFSDRDDTTSCDLEMDRMNSCVHTVS
ncbi:hypothetical protein MJG53_004094 [Ovis ammon polii x Ovis aries]|uniref:C->U-editing enzyme APOBEC-1 n=2 Tax=Ovis TaxID=9935 RepID=A0AAD4YG60_OVIAM|nr:hypothetical protein MG293_002597 [Ovis ammon polii]KAI4586307.1 hypothetical protein MJG53_004094 [Ovis ammon polii x Ovis aries]